MPESRTGEPNVEHFNSTVVKRNEDGVDVLTSYLDVDQGEVLVNGAGNSEAVEAAVGTNFEKQAVEDVNKQQIDPGDNDSKSTPTKEDDAKSRQRATDAAKETAAHKAATGGAS